MTPELLTKWSAIEHQTYARYGYGHMADALANVMNADIDAETRFAERFRAADWQRHNAVAARYAMAELFKLIDMRAAASSDAEPAPVQFLEAAE